MKKIILISALALLVAVGIWFFVTEKPGIVAPQGITEIECLDDNHEVTYEISGETGVSSGTVAFQIKDKVSGTLINEFTSDLVQPGHYYPVETWKCGIYLVIGYKFDATKQKRPEGFFAELTKLDYSGRKIDTMHLMTIVGDTFDPFYSRDFRVSPNEKYVANEWEYSSTPDYSIVFRSWETKEEVYKLLATDVRAQIEDIADTMDMLEWSDDSRYFWFRTSAGAVVSGWVRVDTTDWSYEVYEAPKGVLGGYPFNINNGWVPFIPGAFWTGADIFDEQVKRKREAEGSTADLYLYNVFTQESILVDDTDAPIWQKLGGAWIDNQTFEYIHPNGEQKQFTLPN